MGSLKSIISIFALQFGILSDINDCLIFCTSLYSRNFIPLAIPNLKCFLEYLMCFRSSE